jgi:hypothetical protein
LFEQIPPSKNNDMAAVNKEDILPMGSFDTNAEGSTFAARNRSLSIESVMMKPGRRRDSISMAFVPPSADEEAEYIRSLETSALNSNIYKFIKEEETKVDPLATAVFPKRISYHPGMGLVEEEANEHEYIRLLASLSAIEPDVTAAEREKWTIKLHKNVNIDIMVKGLDVENDETLREVNRLINKAKRTQALLESGASAKATDAAERLERKERKRLRREMKMKERAAAMQKATRSRLGSVTDHLISAMVPLRIGKHDAKTISSVAAAASSRNSLTETSMHRRPSVAEVLERSAASISEKEKRKAERAARRRQTMYERDLEVVNHIYGKTYDVLENAPDQEDLSVSEGEDDDTEEKEEELVLQAGGGADTGTALSTGSETARPRRHRLGSIAETRFHSIVGIDASIYNSHHRLGSSGRSDNENDGGSLSDSDASTSSGSISVGHLSEFDSIDEVPATRKASDNSHDEDLSTRRIASLSASLQRLQSHHLRLIYPSYRGGAIDAPLTLSEAYKMKRKVRAHFVQ